jgi:hypothetical protein
VHSTPEGWVITVNGDPMRIFVPCPTLSSMQRRVCLHSVCTASVPSWNGSVEAISSAGQPARSRRRTRHRDALQFHLHPKIALSTSLFYSHIGSAGPINEAWRLCGPITTGRVAYLWRPGWMAEGGARDNSVVLVRSKPTPQQFHPRGFEFGVEGQGLSLSLSPSHQRMAGSVNGHEGGSRRLDKKDYVWCMTVYKSTRLRSKRRVWHGEKKVEFWGC